jgi:hypothetical protein
MRRFRPRKQYKFWLYHDLSEDTRLMEYAAWLVKTRQFATAIRNGLRLLWTLGEGDTTLLTELFPDVVSALRATPPAPTPTPPDNSGIESRLDRMEALLLSSGAGSPNGQVMKPTTVEPGGVKPIAGARPLALPTFDDDDQDTIVLKRGTDDSGSRNFLANAFGFIKTAQPKDVEVENDSRHTHVRG